MDTKKSRQDAVKCSECEHYSNCHCLLYDNATILDANDKNCDHDDKDDYSWRD